MAWTAAWLIAMALIAEAAEYVDPVAYVRLRSPGHTGTINALAFSAEGRELYSAGNDKSVRVWRNSGEAEDRWTHTTPMRWEVGYGETGRLYALDADAKTGLLAVGGRGGRGSSGEIILFDPNSPKLYRSWRFPADEAPPNVLQHDQVVRSIAFAPNGDWFASSDLEGQVLLWRGASRQPTGELLPPVRRINDRDRKLWKPTGYQPRWRPIAWAGNERLVYPRLNKKDLFKTPNGEVPLWRVYSHDPVSGRSTELGDGSVVFPIYIVAIAATPDGRRIAVAGANRCYLYEKNELGDYLVRPLEAAYPAGEFIHDLAFAPDGRRLLIGRETPEGGRAELLGLEDGKRIVWQTTRPVAACATSEGRLAFAAGSDVSLVDIDAAESNLTRLAGGRGVDKVAFLESENKSSNRLWIRSSKQSWVVDPNQEETLETWPAGQPLPRAVDPEQSVVGWTFEPSTLTVRKQGRALVRLPLDPAREGGVAESAWCWVKGPDGDPRAIAVGTDLSGAILVYDLRLLGDRPKLLRKFVGHEGGVTSLTARPDGELLASGSDDGSTSLWSLAGKLRPKDDAERLMSIWGVRLEADDSRDCRVAELATQGPFFNRGVRVGDRIARLKWRERGPLLEANSFEAIVARLSASTPGVNQTAIYADIAPTERAGDPFGLNFLPIWGPLISFYSEGDSWVAWTPTGHYDASVGGDRLIGWQFNKQQGVAPSFATAQQHHRTFRKPDLIRQLLGAEDEVVVKAIERTLQKQTVDNDRLPEVRVAEEKIGADGGITVSVEIEAPEGETVDEVALINAEGRKVDRIEGPFKPGERVELKVDPVDGSAQEITARVYGSSGTADSKETVRYQPDVELKEKLEKLPQAKSILYLLAVGVSRYEESVGVERLEYAEADAKHVAEIFERHPAYDRVIVRLLTSPSETKGQSLREELRWLRDAADGNDTIGLFFAGHSRVEAAEVSLLPSDGDTTGLTSAELIDRCFGRSIGRKVLILDSCNSGRFREAIRRQTRRSDDADVGVSLFASCAADELAREDPEEGAGVFTSLIVRGLGGAAGRRAGEAVSDLDLVGFLRQDREAISRFSASLQEPVLYIPFAFDRESDLWLTRPDR